MLKETHRELESWKDVAFVIDFMAKVDDGSGHWKQKTYRDAGHPNKTGNRLMYEGKSINV